MLNSDWSIGKRGGVETNLKKAHREPMYNFCSLCYNLLIRNIDIFGINIFSISIYFQINIHYFSFIVYSL